MTSVKINFENEMKFAEEFYSQAIVGLSEAEYPPRPQEWIENYKDLREGWEFLKIGLLTEEDEERKASIKAFLECTLSVYVEFMCKLSYNYEEEQAKANSSEEQEEINSYEEITISDCPLFLNNDLSPDNLNGVEIIIPKNEN